MSNIIMSSVVILIGIGLLIYVAYDVLTTQPDFRNDVLKANRSFISCGIFILSVGVILLIMIMSTYKKCPQCSEKYKTTDELSYCEHCGYDLADYEYKCSNCGEVYAELDGRNYCGKCGKSITE